MVKVPLGLVSTWMGDHFEVPTKLQKFGRNDDYKKSVSQKKIGKNSKMAKIGEKRVSAFQKH